jgi:hypothetical protein
LGSIPRRINLDWSEEDKKFVSANYGKHSAAWLAKKLGRTPGAIWAARKKYALAPNKYQKRKKKEGETTA